MQLESMSANFIIWMLALMLAFTGWRNESSSSQKKKNIFWSIISVLKPKEKMISLLRDSQ